MLPGAQGFAALGFRLGTLCLQAASLGVDVTAACRRFHLQPRGLLVQCLHTTLVLSVPLAAVVYLLLVRLGKPVPGLGF